MSGRRSWRASWPKGGSALEACRRGRRQRGGSGVNAGAARGDRGRDAGRQAGLCPSLGGQPAGGALAAERGPGQGPWRAGSQDRCRPVSRACSALWLFTRAAAATYTVARAHKRWDAPTKTAARCRTPESQTPHRSAPTPRRCKLQVRSWAKPMMMHASATHGLRRSPAHHVGVRTCAQRNPTPFALCPEHSQYATVRTYPRRFPKEPAEPALTPETRTQPAAARNQAQASGAGCRASPDRPQAPGTGRRTLCARRAASESAPSQKCMRRW